MVIESIKDALLYLFSRHIYACAVFLLRYAPTAKYPRSFSIYLPRWFDSFFRSSTILFVSPTAKYPRPFSIYLPRWVDPFFRSSTILFVSPTAKYPRSFSIYLPRWFDPFSLYRLRQNTHVRFLRACKGFHQSAASAKLNPELRLFIEPEKDFINRLRAPN
jgi:hypothetical protein